MLYLPTSLILLGPSTTEIWLQVIVGFHGLYYYASKFWIEHLRLYLISNGTLEDHSLHSALKRLLLFQKRPLTEDFEAKMSNREFSAPIRERLSGLKSLPEVQIFAEELLVFRATMSLEEDSQNNLEGRRIGIRRHPIGKSKTNHNIDLTSYQVQNDPTLFSQVSHRYQEMTEAILHNSNPALSVIDPNLIKKFLDIYGGSALVCRYASCPHASDGFESIQKRKTHEKRHQKRLQCGDTDCEFFISGFATKSTLRAHNRKYHSKKSDLEIPNFKPASPAAKHNWNLMTDALVPAAATEYEPASSIPGTPKSAEASVPGSGPETNAKGKVTFAMGAEVAFRPKLPGVEAPEWIQGVVVKILGEGKSRRYDVQDAEPDEITKKPGQVYRTSRSSMVTIPPLGQPLADYPKGKRVLARYPDTTTFYLADVVGMNGSQVKLIFEGDEDSQVVMDVDRRFVLDRRG